MHSSVVASGLAAEVVLQALRGSHMGAAADYERLQRFHLAGELGRAPHATDT